MWDYSDKKLGLAIVSFSNTLANSIDHFNSLSILKFHKEFENFQQMQMDKDA